MQFFHIAIQRKKSVMRENERMLEYASRDWAILLFCMLLAVILVVGFHLMVYMKAARGELLFRNGVSEEVPRITFDETRLDTVLDAFEKRAAIFESAKNDPVIVDPSL